MKGKYIPLGDMKAGFAQMFWVLRNIDLFKSRIGTMFLKLN